MFNVYISATLNVVFFVICIGSCYIIRNLRVFPTRGKYFRAMAERPDMLQRVSGIFIRAHIFYSRNQRPFWQYRTNLISLQQVSKFNMISSFGLWIYYIMRTWQKLVSLFVEIIEWERRVRASISQHYINRSILLSQNI